MPRVLPPRPLRPSTRPAFRGSSASIPPARGAPAPEVRLGNEIFRFPTERSNQLEVTLFLQFHLLQLGRGGGAEGLPIILIRGAPRSAKLQPRAESSRDSCWLIMNIFMAAQPGFALLLLAEPCYLSVYFGRALGVCSKAPKSHKFGVRVSAAVVSGSAALPHPCSRSRRCHVPGGGCVGPGAGPGSPTAPTVAKGALGPAPKSGPSTHARGGGLNPAPPGHLSLLAIGRSCPGAPS